VSPWLSETVLVITQVLRTWLLTVESDGSQRFWLVVRREFDLPFPDSGLA